MNELSEIRQRLAAARAKGRFLPHSLRIDIGKGALLLRERDGLSLNRFGKELGVGSSTLHAWLELARASAKETATKNEAVGSKVRPVSMQEESVKAPESHLVLRLPSGLRIENATIAEVAEIERALA